MTGSIKFQSGAVLIMSLMVLVVLSLLAVTAVNLSAVNLRIVGNMQASKRGEAAVEKAFELVLKDGRNNFVTDKDKVVSLTIDGGTVTVDARKCLFSESAGESSAWAGGNELALWELKATYQDPVTFTTTTLTRGVRMVMQGNGNCL